MRLKFNSLTSGRSWWGFKNVISILLLLIGIFSLSYDNAIRWISRDLTNDKSTLVQAPSHYLSQCWPRSLSPYGVTRPQWVKVIYWDQRPMDSHLFCTMSLSPPISDNNFSFFYLISTKLNHPNAFLPDVYVLNCISLRPADTEISEMGHHYTRRTMKLLGAILVSLRPSVRQSVHPSVHPSCIPCPLCSAYNCG